MTNSELNVEYAMTNDQTFVLRHWAFVIFFLCSLVLGFSNLQAAPKEFRGVWVATVYNLDWPSKPGLSAATQQAQLRALLDRAASLNLNAILLQVRPASDALYNSSFEPWSQVLSGTAGVSPGYDPLAFAISEAHARGLELHAWVNPFRAVLHRNDRLPSNHVAVEHPEWIRRFGDQLWIDPGNPAARRYVISVITDIARRYPVDGIHLDDYFYPYPVKNGGSFPDEATWQAYGKASGLSRADWRRQNINEFVGDLYRGVKSARSQARFGISPFGIWRPGVPATIKSVSTPMVNSSPIRDYGWPTAGSTISPRNSTGASAHRPRVMRCCSTGGDHRVMAPRSGRESRPKGLAVVDQPVKSSPRLTSPAPGLLPLVTFTGA
jgi:uncharacterized lipoprotein YddW (UPF0748 family)